MLTMLSSQYQLRYTCCIVTIEFQYRSRTSFSLLYSIFEPINSMARFIFPTSFPVKCNTFIIFFSVSLSSQLRNRAAMRSLVYLYSKRSESLSVEFLLGMGLCSLVSTSTWSIIDAGHVLSEFVTWLMADHQL